MKKLLDQNIFINLNFEPELLSSKLTNKHYLFAVDQLSYSNVMGWRPASSREVTSTQNTASERRQSIETQPIEHARGSTRRRNALVNLNLDPSAKAALEIAHMLQRIGDILERRTSTQSLGN